MPIIGRRMYGAISTEVDLCNDKSEVGLCELTCLLKTGTVKNYEFIGEHNALVYCNLITP